MKNIQVIDDAINCTYEIFAINDDDFVLIFPDGQDIEFDKDFRKRCKKKTYERIYSELWKGRVDKKSVNGIHGTLFFGKGTKEKRKFYPTKIDSEMIVVL